MTCGEFNPQLDAVLAGGVAESEPLIGAACEPGGVPAVLKRGVTCAH